MRPALLATFLAVLMSIASPAMAADSLKSRIIGSWRLVAVYDQFTDGSRRETWGPGAQGLVIFTPEGLFNAIIVGDKRAAKAGGVPSEPVGPAVAYYGAYSLDEAAMTFTTRVQQSTFPPWTGQTLVRTVTELSDTALKVEAAPITDPSGRPFVPHLEFERVK